MKFDVTLLVRFEVGEGWVAICDEIGLPVYGDTREEALDQLTAELQEILNDEGPDAIRWLNRHGGHSDVPCPEGNLKLPVDIWYCKVTKRPCPVQGHLDLLDIGKSLAICDAPGQTKAGIVWAFEDGFEGLHHITGKYRCPLCSHKGEHSKNYHYRFSLTLLSAFLDLPEDQRTEFKKRILLAGLPPSLTYTHLCPDCLIATMEKLGPPYQRDATVVRLRVEITAQLPKTGSDSSSLETES